MMFSCLGCIALILFIYRLVNKQVEGANIVIEFLVICCGGCCCLHPYYIMYCFYQMYIAKNGGQSNQDYQNNQDNQGYNDGYN